MFRVLTETVLLSTNNICFDLEIIESHINSLILGIGAVGRECLSSLGYRVPNFS